eukprot:TRINITY_DN8177_c0_g1_i1.p2 TRINITY_DN8177_c0_g1~~TRINITY_DN8177_c0_g1_i1.p2  ORF type:complete len:401 (+),score=41.50 TRINITY_DN8177_c0_g1_i1:1812-3014(+)
MVAIGHAGALWAQLGNLWFFFAAIFGDILLIRFCLCMGFLFLIVNAATGLPLYPDVVASSVWEEHTIFLDIVIWASITGAFHVYSIYLHLKDEATITFTDAEEQVWRFFYRRSGMHRLEMRETLRRSEWVTYKAGDTIVDPRYAHRYFHLVIDGCVEFQSEFNGIASDVRTLSSGDFFDLELGNLFGVRLGFESDSFEAVAKTDCTLLRWSYADVSVMADLAPAISAFWRNMLLYSVAAELNRVHKGQADCPTDSRGNLEDPGYLNGQRSRDFTRELDDEERPRPFNFLDWLRASLAPFPPLGLRHNSLPSTGVIAGNRVRTLAKCIDEMETTSSDIKADATALGADHDNIRRRATKRIGKHASMKQSLANGQGGVEQSVVVSKNALDNVPGVVVSMARV